MTNTNDRPPTLPSTTLQMPASPSAAVSDLRGHLEIVRVGENAIRHEPLARSHIVIGRGPNAHVVLDHTTVSRSHAELVHDPFGRWWVHDLRSTNGTYVNGGLVDEHLLRPGDVVEIGEFTLRVIVPTGLERSISIYPPADDSAPLSRDEDATQIVMMPKAEETPRISAAHLTTIMGFGRKLMSVEDHDKRLQALCAFLVGPDFPADAALVVRVRDGAEVKTLAEAHHRDPGCHDREVYVSSSVLRTMWETREPVLASNVVAAVPSPIRPAGGPTGQIRRLSTPGAARQFAVVACPLDTQGNRIDAVYIELPPKYATREWLTLTALIADAYRQAELVWDMRRHVQATAFVERELQMARQIQEGLVPRTTHFERLDVAIGFEPCRWVGGDYVDAVPMSDGRVLLAVADVCGKGLQAALVASSLHTMVRATVESGTTLRELAQRLNRYLCSYLPTHSFVTMVCIALDPLSGVVECVNAGHPPALVIGSEGQVRFLQSEKNPAFGMLAADLEVERSALVRDEVLVMYTDGLTDVMDEDQQPLGVDRFAAEIARLVAAEPAAPVAIVRDRLSSLLRSYGAASLASDDRTLLIARRAQEARLSLRPSVRSGRV